MKEGMHTCDVKNAITKEQSPPQPTIDQTVPKDFKFWAIIGVINLSYFLALLEATSISTALPTITHALKGDDFIWVGSAYNIASTAFMPVSGGLAQVFGRRPVLLTAMGLFAIGSLICGLARNMDMLIAGRVVQGTGSAGLFSVSMIVLSDLVSLKERGVYNGLLQLTWGITAGIGPAIGGALARSGAWRWLFYLNVPLSGVGMVLCYMFLRLKTPRDNVRAKLARMDWIGSFLVVSSSVSLATGITWGGFAYSWSSAQVLVPLILGLFGLVCFFLYEVHWAAHPLIPVVAILNRTSLSGYGHLTLSPAAVDSKSTMVSYLQIFFASLPLVTIIFYLPVYLQACKGDSPVQSGVNAFPLCFTIAPVSIIAGLSIARSGHYRPQAWVGWAIATLAMGLFGSIKSTTPLPVIMGYEAVAGIGFGIIYSAAYFPVLAPLPLSSSAHALAFYSFVRQFAMIWSVTIGGSILQNAMQHNLPLEFSRQFPEGATVFYRAITELGKLQEPLLSEVRAAFGDALSLMWLVTTGITGLGLISSLFMRGLPLSNSTDKEWGVEEKVRDLDDTEKASGISA